MSDAGRRKFLGGLMAASLIPQTTWADVGSPVFLSAAATQNGDYVLCGIGADLSIVFQVPLPARGHAAAGHPRHSQAVAFARRPGTFAIIIDCATGRQTATLNAPAGRHFYGHGTFSADGNLLYTTENDYDAGRGRVGVWDAARSYVRIDEWDSGGVGPHDIKRLPGSDILVVANGGISTHPETGRTKLNIPTMRSNLAYIDKGQVIETHGLQDDMRKNSIRHLAVSDDGSVAFGMQWQGDRHPATLVGVHRLGDQIKLMRAESEEVRRMNAYVGSVAFSQDGLTVAATSPRGGQVQVYSVKSGQFLAARSIDDASGLTVRDNAFVVTSGTGAIEAIAPEMTQRAAHSGLMFDNHLVRIA